MFDLVTRPDLENAVVQYINEHVGDSARTLIISTGLGARLARDSADAVLNVLHRADAAPTYSASTLVVDLDRAVLCELLAGESFSCVVLAGTLESVRDPARLVADATALLESQGRLVLAVRNIAHFDVKLMLLQGRWHPQPIGLLGTDQARFFTLDTIHELLRDASYVPVACSRVEQAPLSTGLHPTFDGGDTALHAQLLDAPEATTSVFIMSASPTAGSEHTILERDESDTAARFDASYLDVWTRLDAAERELDAYRNLKIIRLSRVPRRVYGLARRVVRR